MALFVTVRACMSVIASAATVRGQRLIYLLQVPIIYGMSRISFSTVRDVNLLVLVLSYAIYLYYSYIVNFSLST